MGLVDGYGREVFADVVKPVEPSGTDVPKVFLDGTLPTSKANGELKLAFRYMSTTAEYSGYCTAKVQGDSSASFPKKNFTLKLYKDSENTDKFKLNFKGWGKQNKFVIKANWIDILHCRNVVCARLWADVVKSRAGYDNLPDLLKTSPNNGVIDGFPVKVYNNGVYLGRYDWNIPKDGWMSSMSKSNNQHCIICSEAYNARTKFVETPLCDGTDWTDELHDAMPANLVTSFQNMANFIINNTDDAFASGLNALLDAESAIDAYCFISTCALWDSVGKNQIFLTYDGTKWIQSMYDMDCSWGMFWTGAWAADEFLQPFARASEYNALYTKVANYMTAALKSRYADLRASVLSAGHIIGRMEQWTDLSSPELVAEDYASTTANGAYTNMPLKTENTVQKLRERVNTILGLSDEWIDGLEE